MIDLKKLEAKFEALFEEETEQSFNDWLEDKKQREVMAFLGEGEVEVLKIGNPH